MGTWVHGAEKRLTDEAELSYVETGGNTDVTNLSAKNLVKGVGNIRQDFQKRKTVLTHSTYFLPSTSYLLPPTSYPLCLLVK